MTVQPWENASALQQTRDTIDGWTHQLTGIIELANIIAPTDFVPKNYRDQPAAVAASILAGREIGIGPMTALQHLHVIDGRPAMSAQLMRGLVLAHGHHLKITTSTGTTCTITGRRAGDSNEQTVTWTIDMARAAGLATKAVWRAYPRAMLLARATGELARALFPDVIGGMAYTPEEAADLDTTETPTPRRTRTITRATMDEPPATPPLADDPGGGTPSTAVPPPAQNATHSPEQPDRAPEGPPRASAAQRAMMFAQLSDLRLMKPRARRIHTLAGLIGRRIISSDEITRDEAGPLLDTLARAQEETITPADLYALIANGWDHIAETEGNEPPLTSHDAQPLPFQDVPLDDEAP